MWKESQLFISFIDDETETKQRGELERRMKTSSYKILYDRILDILVCAAVVVVAVYMKLYMGMEACGWREREVKKKEEKDIWHAHTNISLQYIMRCAVDVSLNRS